MPQENDPRNLPLDDLAHQCEQETTRYFKNQNPDNRYCYEMFRRAIQDNNQDVWQKIYDCYGELVGSWVKRHPGFEATVEDVDYFVNGAFAKLSSSLTAERFEGFSDLEPLLDYLKRCVFTCIVDYLRWAEKIKFDTLDEFTGKEALEPSPEEQVLEISSRQALWNHLNEHIPDEKERWMLRGMFILGFKPQELVEYVPDVFQDASEVYRVKQKVIARLRRDSEFIKLLEENG